VKEVFVDTNLFIRYLTNDDPGKAGRVASLLEDAKAGKSKSWFLKGRCARY